MPDIRYAKPAFDVGFATNHLAGFRLLFETQLKLEYDQLAKLGGGFHQHRWKQGQSIVKVNHARDALEATPPGGYRGLTLAFTLAAAVSTPDGAPIHLKRMDDIDLELNAVTADLAAFARFYGNMLGLAPDGRNGFRLGRSRIVAKKGKTRRIDDWRARGLRYMTVQVYDCDSVMAALGDAGAEIGAPPRTLGQVRYGFVRDFDGNWIEISERASLTGKPVPTDEGAPRLR